MPTSGQRDTAGVKALRWGLPGMFEEQERRSEVTGAGGRQNGAWSGIAQSITQMLASTLSISGGLWSRLSRGANVRF